MNVELMKEVLDFATSFEAENGYAPGAEFLIQMYRDEMGLRDIITQEEADNRQRNRDLGLPLRERSYSFTGLGLKRKA